MVSRFYPYNMYHLGMLSAPVNPAQTTRPRVRSFMIKDILDDTERPNLSPKVADVQSQVLPQNRPYFYFPAYLRFLSRLKDQPFKRRRTIFTQNQLQNLEKVFKRKRYLTPTERMELALSLNLNQLQVKTWFSNRRMKRKRMGKSSKMEGGKVERKLSQKKENIVIQPEKEVANKSLA